MGRIRKLIMIFVITLILVLNGAIAYAADKIRYVDDITDNYKVTKDITFCRAKDYKGTVLNLNLDVYEPNKDKYTNRPVIIWVHGGNLQFGSKADNTSMAGVLAKKGFVIVSIDYRLNPNPYVDGDSFFNTMRNASKDIEAAVIWVRDNAKEYGMDPNNIILGGYSAGAELISNLYYYNSYVPGFDRTGITACIALSGNRLFWPAPEDKASTVGDPNTKCLVIHSRDDTVNPITDVEKFVVQLGDRGVIRFTNGYDHFWRNGGNFIIPTITNFLHDNIKTAEIYKK